MTVQTLRSPRRRRSRTRERGTVPVLTDIPIGLFTSATVLDFLGRRRSRAAVNGLTALGIIGTVPTAAAGLADWSDTHGEDQRIGVIHAVANAAAAVLFTASLFNRLQGRRGRARMLGGLGMAGLTGGGYLGPGVPPGDRRQQCLFRTGTRRVDARG